MRTGTVPRERVPCATHPEAAAIGRCMRCHVGCCDACIVFAINEDACCEACGSTILAAARPRYTRGGLVLGGVWGLVSALWLLRVLYVRAPVPYSFVVLIVGYGGGLFAAWSAVSPAAGVEVPMIARRRPGGALPKGLRSP